jgi:adenine phosphoribosyltransferase
MGRFVTAEESSPVLSTAREALLRSLRWSEGHADVWAVFADRGAFAAVVAGLSEPWCGQRVTRVIGVEARGFLLGGAVALALGAGFVGVRKAGGLLPGPKLAVDADPDYRGISHHLRMQVVLNRDDRVLLVDDWAERGSQAKAVRHLVQRCEATFLGASLMVDQLDADTRAALVRVTSLITYNELDSR